MFEGGFWGDVQKMEVNLIMDFQEKANVSSLGLWGFAMYTIKDDGETYVYDAADAYDIFTLQFDTLSDANVAAKAIMEQAEKFEKLAQQDPRRNRVDILTFGREQNTPWKLLAPKKKDET